MQRNQSGMQSGARGPESSVAVRACRVMVFMLELTLALLVSAPAFAQVGKKGEAPAGPTPAARPVAKPASPKAAPKRATANARNTSPSRGRGSSGANTSAAEITYWETIKDSTDPEDFRGYLKKYPNGEFADIADRRVRSLSGNAGRGQAPTTFAIDTSRPSAPKEAALTASPAQTYLDNGERLSKEGKYSAAEIEYRLALRLDPLSAEAHHGLAGTLFGKKKESEKERALREAVRLNPNVSKYHLSLGVFLKYTKKAETEGSASLTEALLQARQAVQANPRKAQAYIDLADVWSAMGKPAEAEGAIREALKIEPKAEWQIRLGYALVNVKRYGEAETAFREGVRLEPKNPAHHSALAFFLANYEPKRYGEAEAAMREAIRLEPNKGRWHASLARLYRYPIQKNAEAEREFREAIRLEPSEGDFYHDLGDVLRVEKKYAEAEAAYRQALRLQRSSYYITDAHLHNDIGTALSDQEKYAEADSEVREAVRLEPEEGIWHSYLGSLYLRQGRNADAETAYRQALRLDPSAYWFRTGLGEALLNQNKLTEAESEFRQVVQQSPETAWYHARLAQALYKQQKYPEAEVEMRTVIRLYPGSSFYQNELGNILHSQQKYAEAEAAYRESLRLNPNDTVVQSNLKNTMDAQKKR
jgi:Flp pilus assembly protein TadD